MSARAKEVDPEEDEERGEDIVADSKEEVDRAIDFTPQIPAVVERSKEENECKDDKEESDD